MSFSLPPLLHLAFLSTWNLSSPARWTHLASLQALHPFLVLDQIRHHLPKSGRPPFLPFSHLSAPGESSLPLTQRRKKTLQLWQALPP